LNSLIFYDYRFGSLDRRNTTRSSSSRSNSSVDHEPPAVPVVPRHINSQHPPTTILLPNQMYPENSLMRTHSLGNIKNENQQLTEKGFTDLNQISLSESKKNSEKKWIETSLDSSSVESGPTLTHDLPPPIKMHTPPIQPENHPLPYDPLVNHFDTVIILYFFCYQIQIIIHIIIIIFFRFHLNHQKIIRLFRLENGNRIVR